MDSALLGYHFGRQLPLYSESREVRRVYSFDVRVRIDTETLKRGRNPGTLCVDEAALSANDRFRKDEIFENPQRYLEIRLNPEPFA